MEADTTEHRTGIHRAV